MQVPLDNDLRVSGMRVPSRDSIDRAWIRLDNCATLFERKVGSRATHYRSLMADSSQKLWNYFCVREQRTEVPQRERSSSARSQLPCEAIALAQKSDDESAWNVPQLRTSSFAWQLTVLGYGAGNIVYKYRNLLHGMLLRCGNEKELLAYRLSVIGWTSDQGTEYKLADVCFAEAVNKDLLVKCANDIRGNQAFLQPPDGSPQKHWLFPYCLPMVGHLHLVSNALESAVTTTRIWKVHFKTGMQALLSFLNSRGLRDRLQTTCIPRGQWFAFKSFGKQLLDWRWESLGQMLDQLVPLIPILQAHFDLSKMKSGGHAALSEIDTAVLKTVSIFVKIEWLPAMLEMLRCISVTINECIGWLEGCPCHEDIWKLSGKTWAQKQRIFFERTGLTHCRRKGCRASCMASYGVDVWLERICNASSASLTEMLSTCSAEKRTAILAVQQELQESLREEFQAKLQHWRHLPFKPLGMLDADQDRSKQICRECICEWEQCDQTKAHRVAHRFFGDPVVLSQLKSFGNSDAPLQDFGRLHNLLVTYTSIPLVERRIESEHAKIEKAVFTKGRMLDDNHLISTCVLLSFSAVLSYAVIGFPRVVPYHSQSSKRNCFAGMCSQQLGDPCNCVRSHSCTISARTAGG